jgi:hypothetical protein
MQDEKECLNNKCTTIESSSELSKIQDIIKAKGRSRERPSFCVRLGVKRETTLR